MQLAHEARTRKKVTKESLFMRFNYRPIGFEPTVEEKEHGEEQAPSSGSDHAQSEGEAEMAEKETPPTSPPSHTASPPKPPTTVAAVEPSATVASTVEPAAPPAVLPTGSVTEPTSTRPVPTKEQKGKWKAGAYSTLPSVPVKRPRIIRIKPVSPGAETCADSDSDIEILPTKRSKVDEIFDRVPARRALHSSSLQKLRMLANLTSPGRTKVGRFVKPGISAVEMQVGLQRMARAQARKEREERIEELKARGVVVKSAEEIEKEVAEMEDLIERARREGEEIMRKEREESKRLRKENGEVDPLGESSDEDEDEDWAERKTKKGESKEGESKEDEEEDEEAELELSGSDEDADDEDEEEEEADDAPRPGQGMIDNEASESEDEELVKSDDDEIDGESDSEVAPARAGRRTKKNTLVVSDDDDDNEHLRVDTPAQAADRPQLDAASRSNLDTPARLTALHQPSTISRPAVDTPVRAPQSIFRSAKKTIIPGLPDSPAPLGLTQIFAGTMDDTQASKSSSAPAKPTDPFAFLRGGPVPSLPAFESTLTQPDASQSIVPDSQRSGVRDGSPLPESVFAGIDNLSQPAVDLDNVDGITADALAIPFATQLGDFQPSQDAGFQVTSPIKDRFPTRQPTQTQETVETMVLDRVSESPVTKGRMRRREVRNFSDEEEEEKEEEDDDEEIGDDGEKIKDGGFVIEPSIFDVMRKAAKKKAVTDQFNKKRSEAKTMVHEQAEESEDEYAGLGGASDGDESDAEDMELQKAIIDDDTPQNVDERALAAFYA
jgi:mediator of replication checkpoint protein 1